MNVKEVSELVGKKVDRIIKVKGDGTDFNIAYKYEEEVKKLGYDIGSMARDMPRALAKDTDIAKWYNISTEEYPRIEGVVLCEDNRNGKTAQIVIFK